MLVSKFIKDYEIVNLLVYLIDVGKTARHILVIADAHNISRLIIIEARIIVLSVDLTQNNRIALIPLISKHGTKNNLILVIILKSCIYKFYREKHSLNNNRFPVYLTIYAAKVKTTTITIPMYTDCK